MLVGTSVKVNPGETWPQGWARLNALFGPIPAGRHYTSGPVPAPNNAAFNAMRASGARIVTSWKSHDSAAFRTLVRDGGPMDVTTWHEPEDNIENGTLSLSAWHAMLQDMRAIIDDEGKTGVVRLWVCLMAWTIDPASGRNVDTIVPQSIADILDGLSWDAYLKTNTPTVYNNCALTSKRKGLPWAIWETGRVNTTPDADLKATYKHAIEFARDPRGHGVDADPAEMVLLWNSQVDATAPDFRIDALPLTVAYFKEQTANTWDANQTPEEPVMPEIPVFNTLNWSDGFNGTPLNLSTKWNVRDNTWQSNSAEINLAANATQVPSDVQYGKALRLQAKKDGPRTSGSRTSLYSSAYLDTAGKKSFQYGRLQMRAKLPTTQDVSKGMWPAWWLRPVGGGDGEIDMMEAKGDGPADTNNTKLDFAIHHDYLPSSDPAHKVHQNNGEYTLPNAGKTSDWHVYELIWNETSMFWLVDGVVAWWRDVNTTPWFQEVFNKPYEMRLNLQVSSGTFTDAVDATTVFPANFDIDYINYYTA
jgi:beta-glucanase (GH16 family)